jgi:hypothetical protein
LEGIAVWDQFYKVVRGSGIPKVWTSKKGEFEKNGFVPVFLIINGIMIRGNRRESHQAFSPGNCFKEIGPLRLRVFMASARIPPVYKGDL